MIFAIIRNKYSNFGIKVSIRQTQITIVRSILYSIFEFIKIHFPWTHVYVCKWVGLEASTPAAKHHFQCLFHIFVI